MANSFLARLEQVLWPEGFGRDVWMIVDAARDSRVFVTLAKSYLEYSCLYSGPVAPALQKAAPYLVQLEPGGYYTRELLEYAWGRCWGVIIRCDLDLARIRRHLRKFLIVREMNGRKLIFRYYDPRVLRLYLPTCNVSELREFFGPIDAFYLEGQVSEDACEFRREGTNLTQRTHQIGPFEAKRA